MLLLQKDGGTRRRAQTPSRPHLGTPTRLLYWLVNSLYDNRQLIPMIWIGGQANSALNVQGGASPFPVPDSPQFPVRCPLGSLH